MTKLFRPVLLIPIFGVLLLVASQGSGQEKKPDVIFVPTPQVVVDKMLELAEVGPDDVHYDLGCGNGIIVVSAAKKGAQSTGFDVDPQRIRETQENIQKNEVEDRAKVEQKDIFTLDLSDADVITLYLLPSLNVKLIPQLEKLKPGADRIARLRHERRQADQGGQGPRPGARAHGILVENAAGKSRDSLACKRMRKYHRPPSSRPIAILGRSGWGRRACYWPQSLRRPFYCGPRSPLGHELRTCRSLEPRKPLWKKCSTWPR